MDSDAAITDHLEQQATRATKCSQSKHKSRAYSRCTIVLDDDNDGDDDDQGDGSRQERTGQDDDEDEDDDDNTGTQQEQQQTGKLHYILVCPVLHGDRLPNRTITKTAHISTWWTVATEIVCSRRLASFLSGTR